MNKQVVIKNTHNLKNAILHETCSQIKIDHPLDDTTVATQFVQAMECTRPGRE